MEAQGCLVSTVSHFRAVGCGRSFFRLSVAAGEVCDIQVSSVHSNAVKVGSYGKFTHGSCLATRASVRVLKILSSITFFDEL